MLSEREIESRAVTQSCRVEQICLFQLQKYIDNSSLKKVINKTCAFFALYLMVFIVSMNIIQSKRKIFPPIFLSFCGNKLKMGGKKNSFFSIFPFEGYIIFMGFFLNDKKSEKNRPLPLWSQIKFLSLFRINKKEKQNLHWQNYWKSEEETVTYHCLATSNDSSLNDTKHGKTYVRFGGPLLWLW